MIVTDNEIIKALECCMDEMGCTKGCPCFEPKAKGAHCKVSKKLELEKLTLDLINRQKAEKSNLTSNLTSAKAEIERLKQDLKITTKNYVEGGKIIKAEAIKEFAERLKSEIEFSDTITKVERHIDKLVKEMVGDSQ